MFEKSVRKKVKLTIDENITVLKYLIGNFEWKEVSKETIEDYIKERNLKKKAEGNKGKNKEEKKKNKEKSEKRE